MVAYPLIVMATVELQLKERDPVKLWAKLKDSAADVRGFDLVESKGKKVRVPRVTNADVRMLIGRWTNEAVIAGATTGAKDAFKKLVSKWNPAAGEMVAQAAAGDPGAPFDDPVRFWDATLRLAIGLASLKVVPSTWTIVWQSVKEAAIEAPGVIGEGLKDAADFAGRVVKEGGKIVGKGVAGIGEGLGITGLALLALGAVYVATRKKG